ncbi:MAG TPA: YbiU family protein [Propionibacteriaceae bacterium]|nr:YbiU family protein [Propionibacteriaceae bacterium]
MTAGYQQHLRHVRRRLRQGVLHMVPIPKAMAYPMLRPLLDDVDDDDMCGVKPNRTFPPNSRWHRC